jgi:hypothetical protein
MGDEGAVKTRALLVDANSSTVLWLNSAAQSDLGDEPGVGLPIEKAMPLAQMLGVPGALATTAEDGETRHLRTGLVTTSRGGLDIACDISRLPDGTLLVLSENAWQSRQNPRERGSRRR